MTLALCVFWECSAVQGCVLSTGNLKEGKNEVIPEEPGKMGYIQP
jgi:hypothetical protein